MVDRTVVRRAFIGLTLLSTLARLNARKGSIGSQLSPRLRLAADGIKLRGRPVARSSVEAPSKALPVRKRLPRYLPVRRRRWRFANSRSEPAPSIAAPMAAHWIWPVTKLPGQYVDTLQERHGAREEHEPAPTFKVMRAFARRGGIISSR